MQEFFSVSKNLHTIRDKNFIQLNTHFLKMGGVGGKNFLIKKNKSKNYEQF